MNIKKFFIGAFFSILVLSASVIIVLALKPNEANENKPSNLNWGKEINSSRCLNRVGEPVIDVTQAVDNDIDSGEGGNYWAYDNYNRHIQVWQMLEGGYCALVQYEGKFQAQAEQRSPGNTDDLDSEHQGTFQGGYRATIGGTLLDTPGESTTGSIGSFDYECDISGSCDNRVNWVALYFEPGYSFNYDWWGWIYHGGNNGTWVNSVDGNAGDITD